MMQVESRSSWWSIRDQKRADKSRTEHIREKNSRYRASKEYVSLGVNEECISRRSTLIALRGKGTEL